MADRHIGALPIAPDLYDDSLLVVEQQGAAASLTGAQLKGFARAGVSAYVEEAKEAAQTAVAATVRTEAAAEAASRSAEDAQTAQDLAETAWSGAETAREAIEAMEVEAVTLATGQPAGVEKTAAEGHVKLIFGLPAGERGDRGAPGSSIQKIERTAGNGAAGTMDTYTVTLTDGSTTQFQVYNGADGQGAGDMLSRIYDPNGIARDVFAYADSLRPTIHDLTLAASSWEGEGSPYTKTVPVPGVLVEETAQLIQISPDDLEAWNTAGIRCTAQLDGALIFSAQEKPEMDVRVLASVQPAQLCRPEGGESL